MDPLSRDENYPRQLTPEMWREIKSAPPEVIAEMQDDLKHGNTYYTGVETGKGVLLFGRGLRRKPSIRGFYGNEYREAFL